MKTSRHTLALIGALAALACAIPAAAQRGGEPLARFEDPICPGVAGMDVESAEAMVWRIRAIAEELGIHLAKTNSDNKNAQDKGCEPNIIVAFVDDSKEYFNQLRRNRPEVFASLSNQERQNILQGPGPARVLTTVNTRTRDGLTITRRDGLSQPPQTTMWSAHSKIYSPVRNDITAALILIDRDAIKELSIGQLADYSAMRALTQTLPAEHGSDGSILNLFKAETDNSRPTSLTSSDKAFLKNLYRGIPNLPGAARLAEANKHPRNTSTPDTGDTDHSAN